MTRHVRPPHRAALPDRMSHGPHRVRIADAREKIDPLHAELVAGCARGRHVLAERSGHLVPLDQPELIAQCVRETAASTRATA